jgi:hypothetical protein
MEVNLMEVLDGSSAGALLLNLIDYQVGHQAAATAIPSIERVFPSYNVRCRVRSGAVRSVTLHPEGTPVDFSQDGEYVEFVVPKLTYMAMVLLER